MYFLKIHVHPTIKTIKVLKESFRALFIKICVILSMMQNLEAIDRLSNLTYTLNKQRKKQNNNKLKEKSKHQKFGHKDQIEKNYL